jgi:hypothetical protein
LTLYYNIFRYVKIFKIYFLNKKIKNLMEYLRIYHLLKLNPPNLLIIQLTCVEVAKVLVMVVTQMRGATKDALMHDIHYMPFLKNIIQF